MFAPPRSPRAGSPAGIMLAAAMVCLACGGDVESRMAEVRALQDVGQFTASIEELREILVVTPELPEASYRLGVALVQTGERSRAIWPLQKAAESPEYTVQAGTLLATVHLGNHDFDEALRTIDQVLEAEPERSVALQLRTKANIGAKNFDAALADAARLVELFPDDYNAHALHATALLDLGRVEEAEAVQDVLKRLGMESGDPETQARGCLAPAIFARHDLKDPEKAEPLYEECVALFPTHGFVLKQTEEFFDSVDRSARATEIYREAVEKAPENLALRSELASRLRARGEIAEAEQVLLEAAETFGSAGAWNRLSGFYRATGQREKALEAIGKVIELSQGGNDQMRFNQADLLVDLGQLDRAREVARALQEPTYATLIRGRILMAEGDARGALAAFEEGIRNWPNNAAARFLAGIAAREIGDIERAISELREAVRVDKEGTEAALLLARLHLDRGEYPRALTFAQNYLANRQQSSKEPALRIAVRALVAQGRFANARRSIEVLREAGFPRAAAVELAHVELRENGPAAALRSIERGGFDLTDPENEELLRMRAENELGLGRADDALRRVDAAIARSPDSASLLALRATLLARTKRIDEARAAFARAVELDPDHAPALGGLATLAANDGDRPRAVELFDRAAALAPDQLHFAYAAAQLTQQAGDVEGAERRLRAIVERAPHHASARNDLAWLLGEQGRDLDLALALAQEARRLDASANVLDTLGWVHLKRGETERAVEVLEEAAELQPDSASIRYHLAEALAQAGESERAVALLEAALDGGAFPERAEAQAALEHLAAP